MRDPRRADLEDATMGVTDRADTTRTTLITGVKADNVTI